MKQYTDFVFDIDGTLLDTERTGVLSLMQTIRELTGRELSYEEAYRFFGLPSAKAASMVGFSDGALFGEIWEIHFQELMYLVTPFPGVTDVLHALRAKGARLGIVTSRSRPEVDGDPILADLLPLFDLLVSAEDSPRHKPFPDPMLAYLEKAGARPETTLYLGDTPHDFRCGRDAGCDFALACWTGRDVPEVPAEYRFADAAALRRIVGL